jgi:flagellar biosynthetic protein FliP
VKRSTLAACVISVLALLLPALASAAEPTPLEILQKSTGNAEFASAMRIFLALTALSFIPALLICMTCFVRVVIVFSMIRHAIGLMETPPNVVIITLSLFVTLFAMQPVIQKVNVAGVEPYLKGQQTMTDAARKGYEPLRDFMVRQTREQDLLLMVETAGAERPRSIEDVNVWQLIPAFMLSELRSAFLIGFTIFLPFLLIDLIVASVLMALGMMMVPPSTVSIPLKLLLFVLIDGWHIVTRAVLGSIH